MNTFLWGSGVVLWAVIALVLLNVCIDLARPFRQLFSLARVWRRVLLKSGKAIWTLENMKFLCSQFVQLSHGEGLSIRFKDGTIWDSEMKP